ncbi:uncharacterized protein LOC116274425 [Papio anubis]|uniref:uncharacterized protein LOC116274425 n=1 Tax=Papio anubis TaxID=9555 RepID=UPI0012AE5790|nr:uncharacterized protein LOC116274425 [Papio anubis]
MAAETCRNRSSESFLISLRGACPWNDATRSELLHQRILAGSRAVHASPLQSPSQECAWQRVRGGCRLEGTEPPSRGANPGLLHPGLLHPGLLHPRLLHPGLLHPRLLLPGLGVRHTQSGLWGLRCVGSHPKGDLRPDATHRAQRKWQKLKHGGGAAGRVAHGPSRLSERSPTPAPAAEGLLTADLSPWTWPPHSKIWKFLSTASLVSESHVSCEAMK